MILDKSYSSPHRSKFSGGMRYGHFLARDYNIESFMLSADSSYRLVTDWHRYAGRRQYCIEFPAEPVHSAMRYIVRRPSGEVAAHMTAAKLLRWHFQLLREAGENKLYDPLPGEHPSRQARQAWLRTTLLGLIPVSD